MRAVIDGITYDTRTAEAALAVRFRGEDGRRHDEGVYVTPDDHWFLAGREGCLAAMVGAVRGKNRIWPVSLQQAFSLVTALGSDPDQWLANTAEARRAGLLDH